MRDNGKIILTQKQIDGYCKTVYRVEINTFESRSFNSRNEASRESNINPTSILNYCNNNSIMRGYFWSFDKPEWWDINDISVKSKMQIEWLVEIKATLLTKANESKIKEIKTRKEKGISQKSIDATCKTIYRIDINTMKVVTYYSASEASRNNDKSVSVICDYCKKNTIMLDQYWTYIEPNPLTINKEILKSKENKQLIDNKKIDWGKSGKIVEGMRKTVYRKNIETQEIMEYDSVSNASLQINISPSTISKYCRNNSLKENYMYSYNRFE